MGFGYADFAEPEGVLRSLRILNGFNLLGSALKVRLVHYCPADTFAHYTYSSQCRRRRNSCWTIT